MNLDSWMSDIRQSVDALLERFFEEKLEEAGELSPRAVELVVEVRDLVLDRVVQVALVDDVDVQNVRNEARANTLNGMPPGLKIMTRFALADHWAVGGFDCN